MENVLQILLGSSIVASFFTGIMTYYFHKKTERFNAEIKNEFDRRSQIQNTDFEWKKQSAKILGQVYIHLNRTRLAFENNYSKFNEYNKYFEDEILRDSNKHIRDSILKNGHYIPPEILEEATILVEHYDAWLIKYHNLREEQKDTETVQIYVGTDGVPFPIRAEAKFKDEYIKLFNEIMTDRTTQIKCD